MEGLQQLILEIIGLQKAFVFLLVLEITVVKLFLVLLL
jgi:hypothetical protein